MQSYNHRYLLIGGTRFGGAPKGVKHFMGFKLVTLHKALIMDQFTIRLNLLGLDEKKHAVIISSITSS